MSASNQVMSVLPGFAASAFFFSKALIFFFELADLLGHGLFGGANWYSPRTGRTPRREGV